MRVIVGGIGYHNLRDHSVGGAVVERLMGRAWPDGVVVEDLSYNPVAVVHRLEDEPPDRRFQRAVFVGAVARGARATGTVTSYRWDGALPSPERVQDAVAEAVTGVIALDNTLVVARQFGALPEEVVVVEVEPGVEEFGDTFTPAVAEVFDRICTLVATLVTDGTAAARLPEAPLGGGALPRVSVQ